MKRNVFALAALLVVLASSAACSELPDSYSAEAIEAWVIDSETKKPLQGVIVTANWQLLSGWEGSTPVGQMEVLETVTDANGRFYFPVWGPKPRKKGYLRDADPQLILFKPGYEHRALINRTVSRIDPSPLRRSIWNGKRIELKPFRGTVEEYAKVFERWNYELEFLTDFPAHCDWKKVLITLRTLARQRKVIETAGFKNFFSLDRHLLINDKLFAERGGAGCGLPSDLLGANGP